MAGEERRGSKLGRAFRAVFGRGGPEGDGASPARAAALAAATSAAAEQEREERSAGSPEEAALLNQALAESGIGILMRVDAGGRILQANEGMELAAGLSREALVGTEAFSYFARPERARSLFKRCSETGTTARNGEMELRHAQGFQTPVSIAVVAQKNGGGSVSGATFICKPKEVEAVAELVARKASVAWKGDLAEGGGILSTNSSGIVEETPVDFDARVKQPDGQTSPEELVASAHATCYAMALSHTLASKGLNPEELNVDATCAFDDKNLKVTYVDLDVRGQVAGIGDAEFAAIAKEAEMICPISNALRGNVDIRLKTHLDDNAKVEG